VGTAGTARVKPGGHLTEQDQDRIIPQMFRGSADEPCNRGEIALSLVISRRVGSDIDDIAAGQIARPGAEGNVLGIGGEQLVEIRLQDRKVMPAEAFRQPLVCVVAPDREASRRRGNRRDDSEMLHPGKADDSRLHHPVRRPELMGIRNLRNCAREGM
jgi:hypothetical protein